MKFDFSTFSSTDPFRGAYREQAFRYGDRVFRVARTVRNQPSWVHSIAAGAGLLVLLALVFLLVVPFLLVTVLAFVVLMGVAKLRRMFRGLRRPNGALDGRRNVRVITRRE